MSALAEYFDHIYCVSLPERDDKWNKVLGQAESLGLVVERFTAVDGYSLEELPPTMYRRMEIGARSIRRTEAIPGHVGCLLSHRAILKDAIARGFDKILILEDDNEFSPGVEKDFEEFIKQVPKGWGMLYFCADHRRKITPITPNVARVNGSFMTNCYAVRSAYKSLLLNVIPENPKDALYPIDVIYYTWHKAIPAYVFQPHLAWQTPGYSDIQRYNVDYSHCLKPKERDDKC